MDTLGNKCPACGSMMNFNSTTQLFECGNCSAKYSAVQPQTNIVAPTGVVQENNVSVTVAPAAISVPTDVVQETAAPADNVSVSVPTGTIQETVVAPVGMLQESIPSVTDVQVNAATLTGAVEVSATPIGEMQQSIAVPTEVMQNNTVETNDFSSAMPTVEQQDMVDQYLPQDTLGDVEKYTCKSCGVEVLADKATSMDFCIYCGSEEILKERILSDRAPNYIIPFRIDKEAAIAGFKKLIKGKLLLPRRFKKIENISGVYIPFWAYDLEANGEVEFEASDEKRWKDSKYKYKKVDRYSMRKSGHFDFMKVMADASSRFPDDLINSLEPYDYNGLVPYNYSYLSGYLVEKYDVDEIAGLKLVTGKTCDTAVELMRKTVGHENQKVINNGIRVSSRYTHYILLPVWMLNVKHKDKTITFAMNGQTGKAIGDGSVGVVEIIIWSLIFFVILFAIGFIFALFIF